MREGLIFRAPAEIRPSRLTPFAVSLVCYRRCLEMHWRHWWQARPLANHAISPSLSNPAQFLLGLKQRPPSSLQTLFRPALASTNRNGLHFTADVRTQHFDSLDASSCRRVRPIASRASSAFQLLCGSRKQRRGRHSCTVPKRSFQLWWREAWSPVPRPTTAARKVGPSLTAVLP